jgi:hypothetical protein
VSSFPEKKIGKEMNKPGEVPLTCYIPKPTVTLNICMYIQLPTSLFAKKADNKNANTWPHRVKDNWNMGAHIRDKEANYIGYIPIPVPSLAYIVYIQLTHKSLCKD